jgi:CRP-like cAMP-binding protein
MLRQVSFFATLPMEALKVLAYLCHRQLFLPGDWLTRSGEDDGQAFYIISGQLEVSLDHKGLPITLRSVGAGELLGILSLWGPMKRLFSLKASVETSCLVITRDRFLKALEQFPAIVPKIVKEIAQRINAWERQFIAEHGHQLDLFGRETGVSIL